MSDFRPRLEQYLSARNEQPEIVQLTPDASTREYFRIAWRGGSAISCVYPESFIAAEQSYLDVTALFIKCGLPVARVLDFDESLGVIVLEDLGDRILRDVIIAAHSVSTASGSDRVLNKIAGKRPVATAPGSDKTAADTLINDAIALIARIQAATPTAYETNSIASRLKFDTEKLLWELNFFKTHYFETYKKRPLPPQDNGLLAAEFEVLSTELESRACVLCHRDFHAANLMLDRHDRMRIIDHQDARIGSPAYDLVSLLLDRITEPPSAEWLAEKRRYFLNERMKLGLDAIDDGEFAYEFRLQTLQRCLKAAGTFSYQSAVRGKTYFEPFILPMFRIVHRSAGNVDGFPTLIKVLRNEIG